MRTRVHPLRNGRGRPKTTTTMLPMRALHARQQLVMRVHRQDLRTETVEEEGAPLSFLMLRHCITCATRRNDRAASPAETALSVTSPHPQAVAVRANARGGAANKRNRAGPAATPVVDPVPAAALHTPTHYANGIPQLNGPGWSGPMHPQLEGPGMPVARNVAAPPATNLIGPGVDPAASTAATNAAADADGDAEGEVADDKLYCWCNTTSFGIMVACDDRTCPREWVRPLILFLDRRVAYVLMVWRSCSSTSHACLIWRLFLRAPGFAITARRDRRTSASSQRLPPQMRRRRRLRLQRPPIRLPLKLRVGLDVGIERCLGGFFFSLFRLYHRVILLSSLFFPASRYIHFFLVISLA